MRYTSIKKRYEQRPQKYEAMKQVSALIPVFEKNILFALRARAIKQKDFRSWLRRSGIGASRYLFRKRGQDYYPIINLADWQAIANYLRVPLKSLIYEDLASKWPGTANLTEREEIVKVASKTAGSEIYKNRLDF